ncbi:MAG: hypothetical protein AAGD92_14430 [Pseudomonadota bacterium]
MRWVAVTFFLQSFSGVAAQSHASDQIPEAVLDACDRDAEAYEHYDTAIASAANDLIALGVFSKTEFQGVKTGYCDLLKLRGPVGTTSCRRDTILLDEKYKDERQKLVLAATLAHEMKHVLQHREQKAQYGDIYCESDQYEADKAWMEDDADAFGDSVAGLLFVGRSIRIENRCPFPVSIFPGVGSPVSSHAHDVDIVEAGPRATLETDLRSARRDFEFFAKGVSDEGRLQTWRGMKDDPKVGRPSQDEHNEVRLQASARSTGPFVLRFSCDDA